MSYTHSREMVRREATSFWWLDHFTFLFTNSWRDEFVYSRNAYDKAIINETAVLNEKNWFVKPKVLLPS